MAARFWWAKAPVRSTKMGVFGLAFCPFLASNGGEEPYRCDRKSTKKATILMARAYSLN